MADLGSLHVIIIVKLKGQIHRSALTPLGTAVQPRDTRPGPGVLFTADYMSSIYLQDIQRTPGRHTKDSRSKYLSLVVLN